MAEKINHPKHYKGNQFEAIEQTIRDKREEELGIVAHRKDRTPWLVTMTLDDWMEIYKRYLITLE
jgi:hypothetical protein